MGAPKTHQVRIQSHIIPNPFVCDILIDVTVNAYTINPRVPRITKPPRAPPRDAHARATRDARRIANERATRRSIDETRLDARRRLATGPDARAEREGAVKTRTGD